MSEQAQRYLRRLLDCFEELAAYSRLGERGDVEAGCHGFPQGQQVVFYVMASEGIELIAIVHPGADVDSHLGAITTESVPCGPAAGSLLTR